MPNVKDLEMAAAISAYKNITIKKTFFSKKAVYTPSQSPIKVMILDYTPTEGERLTRLLDLPLDKMVTDIQQKGAPKASPNFAPFNSSVSWTSRTPLCLNPDSMKETMWK